MTFDKFKVRCSRISDAMSQNKDAMRLTELQVVRMKELEGKVGLGVATEKQKDELALLVLKDEKSKEVILSTTYIEYLMEVYAWETEKAQSAIKSLVETVEMRKGKVGEKDAGVLLSIVDGELYLQHKDRICNDYLSGEIDFYLGKDVYSATAIVDTKVTYDYPIFLKKLHTGLENGQKEQVQGYTDIVQSAQGYVANCCISMPQEMIADEEYKLLRKINAATVESPEFKEAWTQHFLNINFDRIDPRLRVNKIPINPFTDNYRQNLYDQVKRGRDFLNKFHEERVKIIS